MHDPAISVAMSVYNGERFLGEAIESILAQSFADFEFLIVDDGSNDGSAEIMSDYAARDSRIRPIFRENRGLVASLNQMLSLARAPLVARMDADDVSEPGRFAAQTAFLDANPDYGVAGSWCTEFDEYGEAIASTGSDQPVMHQDMLEAIELGEQLICHSTAMFRRDIVRSVGGYHGAFRHCEDYDLWLRLASVTRLGNVPERLIKYRRHSGQVTVQHTTQVHTGAAIAYQAYRERLAGRTDPTEGIDVLPAIEELDSLFGRQGVTDRVREKVALGLRYSADAMSGQGYDLLLCHVRNGGRREGMWRTVARLMRFGTPIRAAKLATLLLATWAITAEGL